MLQFFSESIFEAPLFRNVDASPFIDGLSGVGVVGAVWNAKETENVELFFDFRVRAIALALPELVRNGRLVGCLGRAPSKPEWMALLLSFIDGVSRSISWMLRSEWLDEWAIARCTSIISSFYRKHIKHNWLNWTIANETWNYDEWKRIMEKHTHTFLSINSSRTGIGITANAIHRTVIQIINKLPRNDAIRSAQSSRTLPQIKLAEISRIYALSKSKKRLTT